MRRRAGMYSGRIGEMVACGWRDAGLEGAGAGMLVEDGDGDDLSPFCPAVGGGAEEGGGGGGGAAGAAAAVRDTELGGGAYDGGFGLKKFRMEGCPLAFVEGRDMFWC